jgi:hypothetical protein
MNDEATTVLDPFRVLGKQEKTQQLDSYLRYLKEANGERDIANKSLSKRDERMADFEQTLKTDKSSSVPLDEIHQYMDSTPPDSLDRRLLWLLIAAKANRGEKYGADRKIEEIQKEGAAALPDITEYILLEEQYHTKILQGACNMSGLDVDIPDPPRALQVIIRQMLKLPKLPSDLLIFLGEVVGVHTFQLMLDNVTLFSDDPVLQKNLEKLVSEILNDEVGHVVYCRSQLGPKSIKLAEKLVRFMGKRILSEIPEIGILAGGKAQFLERLRQPIGFPRKVDWLKEPQPPAEAHSYA